MGEPKANKRVCHSTILTFLGDEGAFPPIVTVDEVLLRNCWRPLILFKMSAMAGGRKGGGGRKLGLKRSQVRDIRDGNTPALS